MSSSKRSNRFFDLFDQNTPEESPSDHFCRPGQQHGALRNMHRHIQHRLDFHGAVKSAALHRLEAHLNQVSMGHICLLIHGKSGHVLKRSLLNYLKSHPRCYAYQPAPSHLGGSGATLARFTHAH